MEIKLLTAHEAQILTATSKEFINSEIKAINEGITKAAKRGDYKYTHNFTHKETMEAIYLLIVSFQEDSKERYYQMKKAFTDPALEFDWSPADHS